MSKKCDASPCFSGTVRSGKVECGKCRKSFHLKCASLNSNQHKAVRDCPGAFWFCQLCRSSGIHQHQPIQNPTLDLILLRITSIMKLVGLQIDATRALCRNLSNGPPRPSNCNQPHSQPTHPNATVNFEEELNRMHFSFSEIFNSLMPGDDTSCGNKRDRTSSFNSSRRPREDKRRRVDVSIDAPVNTCAIDDIASAAANSELIPTTTTPPTNVITTAAPIAIEPTATAVCFTESTAAISTATASAAIASNDASNIIVLPSYTETTAVTGLAAPTTAIATSHATVTPISIANTTAAPAIAAPPRPSAAAAPPAIAPVFETIPSLITPAYAARSFAPAAAAMRTNSSTSASHNANTANATVCFNTGASVRAVVDDQPHRHSQQFLQQPTVPGSQFAIQSLSIPNCIKWVSCPAKYLFPDNSLSTVSHLATELLDSYNTAGLGQINNIVNSNGRVLDLCFVSLDLINDCSISEAPSPLVKKCHHHQPLHLSIRDCSPIVFRDISESIYYDYKNANFLAMNQFLSNIIWSNVVDGRDVNESATVISNVLLYAIDQYVPKKLKKTPCSPPWTNRTLQRLKSAKRSALKKFSKFRTRPLKIRYIISNDRYKRLNKRLSRIHEQRTQNHLKSNPKAFWNYINNQRKESGLPSVMIRDAKEASSTKDICDLFRKQFSSVFTYDKLNSSEISTAVLRVPCGLPIGQHPRITSDAVITACRKLKKSCNVGPDGIPAIVLKQCSTSLATPLSCLFNDSLRSGIFPDCWKRSFVFPVFKKGCKRDVRNYRGIAALCATSKLFESIVLDFVTHNCRNIIAEEQHGFIPKRSTSTNLVSYTSYITHALQQRHQVDAIYTDLTAAFDKINHRIAVGKLEQLGFNGPFLNWLRSYLFGRQMSVKIGDTLSLPFAATSGVPQGSHLGPIIFLLYMNDVHLLLKCVKLSYADDFKLFTIVKCLDDARLLQCDLEIFANWCSNNQMVLNASKCSVISFTRKHSLIIFNYELYGNNLRRDTSVKDLGVILDSKLTFRDHVSYVTSKASRTLGFIFRTAKNFRNVHCLKSLYCSLVRSILEYASVVWAPFYQNSISRIESVQRKFLRFALRHLPWNDPINLPAYEDRCKLIGLDLLSCRRNVAKALFVSDIIQGNIDCSALLQQLNFNIHRRVLRSHTFFRLPVARTNYGHNEPIACMSLVKSGTQQNNNNNKKCFIVLKLMAPINYPPLEAIKAKPSLQPCWLGQKGARKTNFTPGCASGHHSSCHRVASIAYGHGLVNTVAS
ncbi:uncharacterized protein LOC131688131 [Topomyia yanbarensis]|uniref:uncharacterized protein LOC131688131 n=1 Tax=Topomyia yanbarensis TaxID=2498891 RepID=UPI00273C8391|nr:uncharacterized protein LOC131688131 [Topomyia yanbarensis]